MREDLIPILGLIACVGVATLFWILSFGKARRMVNQWARSHNYEVLFMEYRSFKRGLFWKSTSKLQVSTLSPSLIRASKEMSLSGVGITSRACFPITSR